MSHIYIYTGWWLTYPSEKYEFVSWDDDVPNIWEKCSKPPTYIYIYVCTWSFKGTPISARANFCSRNPNLLVLHILLEVQLDLKMTTFRMCARLREIALIVGPVLFNQ